MLFLTHIKVQANQLKDSNIFHRYRVEDGIEAEGQLCAVW